jgi:hypothetical protein
MFVAFESVNGYNRRMTIDRITLPSAEEINSLLQYNPKTGLLIWRARPATSAANKTFNTKYAGKEAGTLESWGYRQLRIYGKLQMAHRVIWKMVTGEEPPDHLDHKDGKPSNNRWLNLRTATSTENAWNRSPNANNTSGFQCIYPMNTKRATSKKFRVLITVQSRKKLIGDFHTIEEANAALDAALTEFRDDRFRR